MLNSAQCQGENDNILDDPGQAGKPGQDRERFYKDFVLPVLNAKRAAAGLPPMEYRPADQEPSQGSQAGQVQPGQHQPGQQDQVSDLQKWNRLANQNINFKRQQDGIKTGSYYASPDQAWPVCAPTNFQQPGKDQERGPDQQQPGQVKPKELIKIWPMILLAAKESGHGGSIRLWQLLKYLDKPGCGWVENAEMIQALERLGVHSKTFNRWLQDAKSAGLITEHETRLYTVSAGRAAVIVGCDQVRYPVWIPLANLYKSGWKAFVFAGYEKSCREDRPISQKTKAKITGVCERSQRYYRDQLQITNYDRHNYSKIELPGNHAAAVEENLDIHVFESYEGELIQRLPDIKKVPENIAKQARPGRSAKIKKYINSVNYSLSSGMQGSRSAQKMYFASQMAAQNAIKANARKDVKMPEVIFSLKIAKEYDNHWQRIVTM